MIKINLSAGDWHVFFENKETKERLSEIWVLRLDEEGDIETKVPADLRGNPNVVLTAKRIR